MPNISTCIKHKGVIFSFILFSIPIFQHFTSYCDHATGIDPLASLVADEQKEGLETLLFQTIDQLKGVDASLEDLATVVSNDIVKAIKDKSDHVTKLKLLRGIITTLTGSSYVVVDEQTIFALIHITRSIANFMIENIKDGFYELEYFDISCINIPQVKSVTIEDIQRELAVNNKVLSELDYRAANVGLCWYNKMYRTTKKRIVRPWRKYYVGPALLVGTIASATGLLLYWRFGSGSAVEKLRNYKIPGTDTKLFGPVPKIDISGINVTGENGGSAESALSLGVVGKLEHITNNLIFTNQAPITSKATFLTGTIAGYFSPTIKRWVSQQINKFDNFMMGGAYRNRPVGNIQYLSKTNFDNVIGCEEAKEIGKTLCLYLKNPERFDRVKLTPTKGYLLVGPTRTGKSFFVEALLGELQRVLGTGFGTFKIYKISYAEVEEKGIQYILALAKDVAPCILFIDEIDLLGLQRTDDRKRLSEFLTAMSGYLSEIDPDKAVIIIGATNKQESIDFALKQPGRFGITIPFEHPNYAERQEFIKRELTKLAVNLDLFDIDRLARESEGYVFEAIGLVIKKAMIKAKVNNVPITQEILERSFDETIRGILEDTKTIPDEQKMILAVHQAGHALANLLLDPNLKLNKVTIQKIRANVEEQNTWVQALHKKEDVQRPIEYGQIFYNHEQDALEFESKEELLKQCKVLLAGHIAERIVLGACSYSYHAHDREGALKMAQSIIIGGLPLDQLPKDIKNKYLTDAYNLMTTCEQEVEALLQEHKDKLENLAQALKEKGTLGLREINSLLHGQEEETTKNGADNALTKLLAAKNSAEQVQTTTANP